MDPCNDLGAAIKATLDELDTEASAVFTFDQVLEFLSEKSKAFSGAAFEPALLTDIWNQADLKDAEDIVKEVLIESFVKSEGALRSRLELLKAQNIEC